MDELLTCRNCGGPIDPAGDGSESVVKISDLRFEDPTPLVPDYWVHVRCIENRTA